MAGGGGPGWPAPSCRWVRSLREALAQGDGVLQGDEAVLPGGAVGFDDIQAGQVSGCGEIAATGPTVGA